MTSIDNLTLDLGSFLTLYPQRVPLLTWFIGAGASVGAGLPSAGTLTWEFKRSIYCTSERVPTNRFSDLSDPQFHHLVQSYFDARGGFPPKGGDAEYAAYFEAYLSDERDRRRFLAGRLQGCKPSYGHTCLAGLMALQKVRIVWTTNFDTLLEAACAAPQIAEHMPRSLSIAGLEQPEKATDLIRDEQWPVLVKLHGDFQYRRLKNTSTELAKQDETLRHMLSDSCSRMGLAVVGYSGRDQSIMAALADALAGKGAFPHGLFWFVRATEPPHPAVVELLSQAQKQGVQACLVRVTTFDELMADVFMPYQDAMPKVRDLIRDLRPRRHPYQLAHSKANTWPVLRTNALRVESHPASCTLFQAAIGGSAQIKTVIASRLSEIIVKRRKQGLIAFGARDTLAAVFAPFGATSFDRYSIEDRRLRYDSAELGLLYHAIVQGIANTTGLSRYDRGRGRLLFLRSVEQLTSAEQQTLKALASKGVWNIAQGKMLHEALRLALETRDQRLWLLLEPTVVITTNGQTPYDGLDRSEIVRESLVRRYNEPMNRFVEWWIAYLQRHLGSPLRVSFPSKKQPEASFEVATTTAYSRKQ